MTTEGKVQMYLAELLCQRAWQERGKDAFVYLLDSESEECRITYGRLDERARGVAAFLESRLPRQSRVILALPFGPAFTDWLFGCMYAGMIAVPAPAGNMDTDAPRVRAAAADCSASMVVCAPQHRSALETFFGELLPPAGIASSEAAVCGAEWRFVPPAEDEIAFLQYTSGSVSEPKGVIIRHSALIENLAFCREVSEMGPDTVIVSWLPHYFDLALVAAICLGAYCGGTVVQMAPERFIQKPLRWLRAIERFRGTMALAPNFAFDLCVETVLPEERDGLDLSTWNSVICGGERVNPETMDRFAAYFGPSGFRAESLSPSYGLAEATVAVTVSLFGQAPVSFSVDRAALGKNRIVRVAEGAPNARRLAGAGPVPALWEVAIVDPETLRRCAPDELGEIWLRGKSLASGYWNQAEKTAEVFGGRLEGESGGPYLRTGDLGVMLEGQLIVLGRQNDVIIMRGFNHYAQDIERTVQGAAPEWRAQPCAAFAVQDAARDLLVIAIEADAAGDAREAAAGIRRAVTTVHGITPDVIVFVQRNGVPKTSTGKVQRLACRRLYEEGRLPEWARLAWGGAAADAAEKVSATATGLSRQQVRQFMRNVVARYLGVSIETIDPKVSFRSLGLDSTASVRLTGELSAFLGRSLAPSAAFDHPNIDLLSAFLCPETTAADMAAAPDFYDPDEPIAIVGMACRFPGGPDLESFWELLKSGGDAIREVPPERWDIEAVYDPNPATPGKMHTRWAGFIDGVDQFDAPFFRMSPPEAAGTDPQHRLLLETAWEALEHGGIAPDTLSGSRTGVFIGIGTIDYIGLQIAGGAINDAYSAVGVSQSIASNRVSYLLGLQGPSMSLDTACSSALTAVHYAMQSLRRGECSMAIAGAVSLILAPVVSVRLSQARMLSPSGKCRTFDADADGYTRGEGCGAVVLKRLRDALADGDTIHAVIRGSAINHCGHTNGITAPSSEAQTSVIRAALADARIVPERVDYIEAHGTGTPLGDPIEFTSISRAVLEGRKEGHPCRIASVKTNIGHLEIAAGMAGLIKTALCLKHRAIPPHLHLQTINPLIALDERLAKIPASLESWPERDAPPAALVNAFGFGGTNACLVLEEGPAGQIVPSGAMEREPSVLTLSANNEAPLRTLAGRYAEWLPKHPELSLGSACATANTGRAQFAHRLAVVTGGMEDASRRENLTGVLTRFAAGEQPPDVVYGKAPLECPPPPAFLFSGQGAQFPGMGRRLFETEPLFRDVLRRCDEILRPVIGESFLSVMFGDRDDGLIHQARFAQPALFALEYALAEVWASWGVRPSCVLGHSIGEIAAACRAGVFGLEDGLRIAAERGRLMHSLAPDGAMATVFAEVPAAEEVIAPYAGVVIAAYNGPSLQVISGCAEGVSRALEELERKNIRAKRMTVSHAFHSPMMEPILDQFMAFAREIAFKPLSLPLYSTVRGALIPAGTILDAAYWRDNIRQPVRFEAAMKAMSAEPVRQFIELGPDTVLVGMGRRSVSIENADWLSSLRRNQEDAGILLRALATVYVRGHHVDWKSFAPPAAKVALPTYPFQRKHCWIEYGREDVRAFGVPGISPSAPENGSRLTLEQQRGLARAFVALTWNPVAAPVREPSEPAQTWLVFGAASSQGEELAHAITHAGCSARYVSLPSGAGLSAGEIEALWPATSKNNGSAAVRHIAYAGDGRAYAPAPDACVSFLSLLQYALAQPPAAVRVSLITRGAHSVEEGDVSNPSEMALWGLGRTAVIENPGMMRRMIDVPENVPAGGMIEALISKSAEPILAYRGGTWFGARLDNVAMPQAASLLRPRKDAAYLITGGFGALGLATAHWLAQEGARRLVLLGRTPLPPRREWASLAEEHPAYGRARAVLALERLGVTVHLAYADMADGEALEAWLSTYAREMYPPIRGVFHLAGDLADASLQRLTAEDLRRVFASKVMGAWHLHRYFTGKELDCFVLFSSVAGLLGSPGQGNYAAANAWLDGLALRRKAGKLPALSIAWGPWSAAGMAARPDRIGRMERIGIQPITPEQGVASLGLLCTQAECGHVGVFEADWRRLSEGLEGAALFLERVLRAAPETPKNALAAAIREKTGNPRKELLEALLREHIARMFGRSIEDIQLEKSAEALGIDSLAAMDIVRELSKTLDFIIVAREFFRHPTLLSFIHHVGDEMDRACGAVAEEEIHADGGVIDRLYKENCAGLSFRFEHPKRNPRAAFIFSSPRSGSTLLRAMLSANSALFAPPELHLLWFADMQERQTGFKGVLGDTGLGKGLARAMMQLRGVEGPAAEALVKEWIERKLPIHEVYRILQEEAAPRLLVDKSPSYTLSLKVLRRAEALFESPLYIYLYRHPYAVMESVGRQRLWNWFEVEGVSPQVLAEETWAIHNRNAQAFLREIPQERQHWIAFEELVARPEEHLNGICAFLGAPFEESMLFPHAKGAMLDDTRPGKNMAGDPNFMKRSSIDPALGDKWRQAIPERPIGPLAQEVALRLRYEIPGNGSVNPEEAIEQRMDVVAMDEETL